MSQPIVLLVEDDEGPRNFQKMVLRQAGYEVFDAEDGLTARQIYDGLKKQLSIIVTDRDYPDGGGFEFIEYVRAVERKEGRSEVPIVMVTGNTNDWVMAQEKDKGRNPKERILTNVEVLFKPLTSLKDLVGKANQMLAEPTRSPSLVASPPAALADVKL